MASPMLFFVLLVSLSSINLSTSELTENYYEKTCPNFEKIMTEIINAKQKAVPRTMGSTFRTLFHDCMVDGCDASILLKTTSQPSEDTELNIDINESLSPEGPELVNTLKEALEKACPGVVSCADILAYSARNLIELTGGPRFKVPLGRKDGKVSLKSHVEGNLPRDNSTVDEMIKQFTQKGMTMEDLVATTIGGHTAGSSHCRSFAMRFFGYNATHQNDPSIDAQYAEKVRKECLSLNSLVARVYLDEVTPLKFDNVYCENMRKNRVLVPADQLFVMDPRTRAVVELYAKDEKAFFDAFVRGMERMVMVGIKDEKDGEVRTKCDMVNTK